MRLSTQPVRGSGVSRTRRDSGALHALARRLRPAGAYNQLNQATESAPAKRKNNSMTTPDIPRSEIANALEFRHACKAFDASRKIPDSDVELIVDAIRLAPSSYGFEPWNVIVAQSEDLRNAVKAFAGNNAARFDASHFLIFTAKTGLQITRKGGHIDHILRDVRDLDDDEAADFKAFWNKWAERDFKLITADVVHQWAARQAYIALGGVMLAAAERGIDSCPIEGFSIDGVREILTERGLIDPTDSAPVVMLALGYRAGGQPAHSRRDLEEIVRWA